MSCTLLFFSAFFFCVLRYATVYESCYYVLSFAFVSCVFLLCPECLYCVLCFAIVFCVSWHCFVTSLTGTYFIFLELLLFFLAFLTTWICKKKWIPIFRKMSGFVFSILMNNSKYSNIFDLLVCATSIIKK